MLFTDLNLHPNILKGIADLGFERPTPVQQEAIPHILLGKDVIASAQTGTGKTAAFVLPILHRLLSKERTAPGIRALFISPTRELALQSVEHLKSLSAHVPLRGHAIFGGVPMEPQIAALERGIDIVSATPGRLLDLVYQGRVDFGALECFVLDEADRMMDMGFLPDIKRIITLLPPKRQNLIFSATMPPEIVDLARQICEEPVRVEISFKSTTPSGIRHAIYPVGEEQKTELLLRLIQDTPGNSAIIIFTRTKHRADRLAKLLERASISTAVLHSDRSQGQRLAALDRFKQGRSQVLVATDIAARGIDVKDVTHVINYDVPQSPEDYIHRIGRTARAEATGDAFTLVAPVEETLIESIEKVLNKRLPRITLPDFTYKKHQGHSRSHGGGHSSHPPAHRRPAPSQAERRPAPPQHERRPLQSSQGGPREHSRHEPSRPPRSDRSHNSGGPLPFFADPPSGERRSHGGPHRRPRRRGGR